MMLIVQFVFAQNRLFKKQQSFLSDDNEEINRMK